MGAVRRVRAGNDVEKEQANQRGQDGRGQRAHQTVAPAEETTAPTAIGRWFLAGPVRVGRRRVKSRLAHKRVLGDARPDRVDDDSAVRTSAEWLWLKGFGI